LNLEPRKMPKRHLFYFQERRVHTQPTLTLPEVGLKAVSLTVLVRSSVNIGAAILFEDFAITTVFIVGDDAVVSVKNSEGKVTQGFVTVRNEDLGIVGLQLEDSLLLDPEDEKPEFGCVSGLGQSIMTVQHSQRRADEIVIDGTHPRGFNGGPILNDDNQLIGMTMGIEPTGVRMIGLPSETLAEFVNALG
jgi:hypothetical protein